MNFHRMFLLAVSITFNLCIYSAAGKAPIIFSKDKIVEAMITGKNYSALTPANPPILQSYNDTKLYAIYRAYRHDICAYEALLKLKSRIYS